jgi:hypothetical protein
MLHHGSKILIQQGSQARPIALRLRRHAANAANRHEDTDHHPSSQSSH